PAYSSCCLGLLRPLSSTLFPYTTLFRSELARRTGRTNVRFVAVEASDYLHGLIPVHLAENGFDAKASEFKLVHGAVGATHGVLRSEEHTSELQSRENLVCRLLLEKKKSR